MFNLIAEAIRLTDDEKKKEWLRKEAYVIRQVRLGDTPIQTTICETEDEARTRIERTIELLEKKYAKKFDEDDYVFFIELRKVEYFDGKDDIMEFYEIDEDSLKFHSTRKE